VGTYTASLAEALNKHQGVEVAVLTGLEAHPSSNEFAPEVFPVVRNWNLPELFRILRVVRNWHPDVVHIQYPTQGYRGGLLRWLLPIFLRMRNSILVQTWHEYLSKDSWGWNLTMAIPARGITVVRPDYLTKLPAWFRWLIRRKQFRFIANASSIPPRHLTQAEKSTIRRKYFPQNGAERQLIVSFGFAAPHKGVARIFELADPDRYHVLLVGKLDENDPYHQRLRDLMSHAPWKGCATATGFLPTDEVAEILAAADAVVFPFVKGGGIWNRSVHAAVAQGSFVLMTSQEKNGYDPSQNIYFARPGDIAEMRAALSLYSGRNAAPQDRSVLSTWEAIVRDHVHLYQTLLQAPR
jgi:glycosyltransferase involved in cell wall biosynthesis